MAKKAVSKPVATKRTLNTVIVVIVLLIVAYLFYQYQASANVVWGD